MKIIGAGWGRTGTTSAAAALDRLGFGPCVEMQTMWQQPELADVWAAHYAGRPADWTRVLGDFGASVDWPGVWEWRRFADLWPQAKVLLTLRDGRSWYDGVMGSIRARTARGQEVRPPAVAKLLDRIWDEDFGGWEKVFDRDRTIALYNAHVAEVLRTCPPERLIEWRVTDGWAPLCDRLDIDPPAEPVPHLNERSE